MWFELSLFGQFNKLHSLNGKLGQIEGRGGTLATTFRLLNREERMVAAAEYKLIGCIGDAQNLVDG